LRRNKVVLDELERGEDHTESRCENTGNALLMFSSTMPTIHAVNGCVRRAPDQVQGN